MLNDITNYFQMTDRVATSGQPTPEQFAAIAEAGYEVIINLAMPDGENALPNEGYIVTSLGMTYVHIPVPWESPDLSHLTRFMGVMTSVEPAKTWIHCVVNARVSAFNYHYLKVRQGLAEEECESPLLKKWRPEMQPVWKSFLEIPAEQLEAFHA